MRFNIILATGVLVVLLVGVVSAGVSCDSMASANIGNVCVFSQDANYKIDYANTVRDNFRMYGDCMNFTVPNQIGQETTQYITPTHPKATTISHFAFPGTPFKVLKMPARWG